MPSLQIGFVVKTEREIGFAKSIIEAGLEHCPRSADRFFRRLPDEHDRSRPLILQSLQRACGPDERRHVRIVAAGVHHVNFSAVVILGCDFARVRKSGVFFDRQCIEVGAHQDGRAGAIFHDAHDAVTFKIGVIVFAEVLRHFASNRAQFLRDQRRRLFFPSGKLGMAVDIFINRQQRRQLADRSFFNGHLLCQCET